MSVLVILAALGEMTCPVVVGNVSPDFQAVFCNVMMVRGLGVLVDLSYPIITTLLYKQGVPDE